MDLAKLRICLTAVPFVHDHKGLIEERGLAKISFTIDNRELVAEEGENLLKVALAAGIKIPNLCSLSGKD